LEGTSGVLWFRLLLKEGLTVRSYEVDQCVIQYDLENLQEWKLHNLPGQAVPLLNCPQGQ